ncbi:laccase [Crepidotus variabilis]|uniref:Laccase n=1 Tax=Crepidotus variabilis TaxID=179855 RepID=A0A9P6ERA3_9AGAR|nr:laccase [Crepidotus variabilis]
MTLFSNCIASVGAICAAFSGNHADLFIGNSYVAPDGFNRSSVLAGAADTMDSLSFPGPLITNLKDGEFNLNVVNQLRDPSMLMTTSIHWHGFFQRGSSWADGPSGVTQCPITPNHSFKYSFSTEDQAGTFWYHSHHSTQYCDGLRGPMVVYDPNDPHRWLYDVDDASTVITLADWYHKVAPQAGPNPTADATLINGVGRYLGGPPVPLAVINVEHGKRYRFRLVSISCDPNYIFSIDSHNLTIIEADSENTQPLEVDSLQIFAGQRYSFVLIANQKVDNYWVRADPNVGTKGFEGGLNSAILRYVDASESEPTSVSSTSNRLFETNLHPLDYPDALGLPFPGGADVNINLDIAFRVKPFLAFTVNDISFVPPTVPALLQIMSGAKTAQDLMPTGSYYALPPHAVVELSLPARAGGSPHPIHLHGHSFQVIQSAGNSIRNYVDPVRRDVVSIGTAGDNVTIRFKTDNAGPWFLHCHIDWHLELGLAVVFAEDIEGIQKTSHPPEEWDQLCPLYNSFPQQNFSTISAA